MSWADTKYALNSTIGTTGFKSLDLLIQDKINAKTLGTAAFTKTKLFTDSLPMSTVQQKSDFTINGPGMVLYIWIPWGYQTTYGAEITIDEELISSFSGRLIAPIDTATLHGVYVDLWSVKPVPIATYSRKDNSSTGNPGLDGASPAPLNLPFVSTFKIGLTRQTQSSSGTSSIKIVYAAA